VLVRGDFDAVSELVSGGGNEVGLLVVDLDLLV
jgi:hypothetical protein